MGKVLYYKIYFEESNINQKPLIWFKDKIIVKCGQKKLASFVLGKVYENCAKIKKMCNFKKLTSKRVTSNEILLFCPKIR